MKFTRINEYVTLPIAIALSLIFTIGGNIFGYYTHGVEVFQKLVLGLVFLLVINVVVRLVYKPIFPTLYRYLDGDNKEVGKWEHFSPKEKSILAYSLFALFFWGLVHLVSSL